MANSTCFQDRWLKSGMGLLTVLLRLEMEKSVKRKKAFFSYSTKALQAAINELETDPSLKVRTIAKKYNVPHVTLQRKLKKGEGATRTMGPKTILSSDEEILLVKWILASGKRGLPLNKAALCETVKAILDDDAHRKVPFKDNLPGDKWFSSFLRRHPAVSHLHAEGSYLARAPVTEEAIRLWHADLKSYLLQEGHSDILTDATRIFNADESGFATCPKTDLVLAPRGDKNMYVISGPKKENITTLITISAVGDVLPPMVVLPEETVPKQIAENINPAWTVGWSKSGWMTGQAFYSYVGNSLIPYLHKTGSKLPVLLLIDGHKFHLTWQVATLCRENGIILYSFHPNSTDFLQPADVSVFQSLKSKWKDVVGVWKRNTGHRTVTKQLFGPLLEAAVKQITPSAIRNGFRKCGIFPFDADAIDFTHIMSHESWTQLTKPVDFRKEHFFFVESMMRVQTVSDFKKNAGCLTWRPDEQSRQLFEVWQKLRFHVGLDESLESQEVGEGSSEERLESKRDEMEGAQRGDEESEGRGYHGAAIKEELHLDLSAFTQTFVEGESFADYVTWPSGKRKRETSPAAASRRWLQHIEQQQEKKQARKLQKKENTRLKAEMAKPKAKKRGLKPQASSSAVAMTANHLS